MPWVELNGERKKVACGPCIRGHRSSKCEHKDRVLLEVRKPGRPLSSCPHPPGSCSCERVVINYTIPKKADCNCSAGNTPQDAAPTPSSTSTVANSSTPKGVQKTRAKRASTANITPSTISRVLKDNPDIASGVSPLNGNETGSDTEPTSHTSRPSNGVSPSSSRTSTGLRVENEAQNDTVKMEISVLKQPQKSCCSGSGDTASRSRTNSDLPSKENEADQEVMGSCCSSKKEVAAKTVEKKSCCSVDKVVAHVVNAAASAPNSTSTVNPGVPSPSSYHVHPPNGHHPLMPGQAPYLGYQTNGNGMAMSPYGVPLMQQNSYFPQPSTNFHHTGHPNGDASASGEHNCNCGDSCACLGCASHPRNDTTMEYIRYYSQYLLGSGAAGVARPPPYHVANHYIPQPAHFAYHASHGLPNGHISQLYIPPHTNGVVQNGHHMHFQPSTPSHSWQLHHGHSSVQATPTSELDQLHFISSPPGSSKPNETNGHAEADIRHNNPSTVAFEKQDLPGQQSPRNPSGKEQDQGQSPSNLDASPMLSPSSFFMQSLELPGCDDPTGTCQCGDGCSCVGCLTHGGHNGIELDEQPNAQETALNFEYNPDFAINSFTEVQS